MLRAALTMMRRPFGSTIARIGLLVIAVEIATSLLLGRYYLGNLELEIDRRAAARLAAPGRLMQDGLLRLASVSDHEIMQGLVGEDLVLAMVVGRDLNIFYATDPHLPGRSVTEVTGVDPGWFGQAESSTAPLAVSREGVETLVSIT